MYSTTPRPEGTTPSRTYAFFALSSTTSSYRRGVTSKIFRRECSIIFWTQRIRTSKAITSKCQLRYRCRRYLEYSKSECTFRCARVNILKLGCAQSPRSHVRFPRQLEGRFCTRSRGHQGACSRAGGNGCVWRRACKCHRPSLACTAGERTRSGRLAPDPVATTGGIQARRWARVVWRQGGSRG